MAQAIAVELHGLRGVPAEQRVAARLQRYRRIGLPNLAEPDVVQ